jgi:protease-4
VTVTPLSPGMQQPEGPRAAARGGCLTAFAVFSAVGLAISLLMNFALIGKAGGDGGVGPGSLHERTIDGTGDDKIVLLSVEGVIQDKPAAGLFGGGGGEGMVKRIKDQLDRAKQDKEVKGVLLDIDSPGGTVTASDQIHRYLMEFRKDSGKPIVVHQGALAASGGYYISAAGDEILCEPTTITGSIGVILGGLNAHRLLKEHGVDDVTITSGPNKDLLSMTGEPKESHRIILQQTVDEMYETFCGVVAEGIVRRTKASDPKAVMADVKKLADGRIYTPTQAIDLKLVDRIGYIEDAFAAVKKRAGVTEARLIQYRKQPSFLDALQGNVETKLGIGGVNVNIDAATLDELLTPRALVLWRGN